LKKKGEKQVFDSKQRVKLFISGGEISHDKSSYIFSKKEGGDRTRRKAQRGGKKEVGHPEGNPPPKRKILARLWKSVAWSCRKKTASPRKVGKELITPMKGPEIQRL